MRQILTHNVHRAAKCSYALDLCGMKLYQVQLSSRRASSRPLRRSYSSFAPLSSARFRSLPAMRMTIQNILLCCKYTLLSFLDFPCTTRHIYHHWFFAYSVQRKCLYIRNSNSSGSSNDVCGSVQFVACHYPCLESLRVKPPDLASFKRR